MTNRALSTEAPKNQKVVNETTAAELREIDKDPFKAFSEEVSQTAIIGQLLKFSKGEWLAGRENEEVPLGTKFVVNFDSLLTGWIKWVDNKPEQHVMGLVLNRFKKPKRHELGDLDENTWEVDRSGNPRDPWQEARYVLMKKPGVAFSRDTAYTYSASSEGSIRRLHQLAGEYSDHRVVRDDSYPVVTVDRDSYPHREFGKIWVPIFQIFGWEPKELFEEVGLPQRPQEEQRKPSRRRRAA